MFGGTGEKHENSQDGRFGCEFLTDGFGMQVGGVRACAKLLREIRNSLLPVTDRSNSRTSRHCLSCLLNYKASYLSKQQYCVCYKSSQIITRCRVLSETPRVSLLSKKFLNLIESQSSLPRSQ
jgi:hypothetical protein